MNIKSLTLNTIATHLLVATLGVGVASANPNLAGQYDARSVGLAGTGTSYLHNASAAFHNPAALDGIEKLSISGVLTTSISRLNGPIAGVQVDGQDQFSPLFFLGGSYRIWDPLTIGAAVFVTSGLASGYKDAPAPGLDPSVQLGVMELNIPVSFRIMKGLSIGASYRLGYAMQSLTTVNADAMGNLLETDLSVNGIGPAGLSAGIWFQPVEMLELGFNYKSRMDIGMSGDATVSSNGQQLAKLDAETATYLPHTFTLGANVNLLKNTLMLAADFQYVLFENSNKELEITTSPNTDMEQVTVLPTNWRNSFVGKFGVEYVLAGMVPLRAGYSFLTSAGNEEYPNPLTPAPGVIQYISLGAGLRIPNWQFDLGGQFFFNSYDVEPADVAQSMGGEPGNYSASGVVLAGSVAYNM